MSCFPMCVELAGKKVFLVGAGRQIQDKKEKLEPFGADLIQKDTLGEQDLRQCPAFVVVGDTAVEEAQRISELCNTAGIPVNVVDMPALCSFFFPALISRGPLTVAVSTGGSNPAAAGFLRREIEKILPETTETIINWLSAQRQQLRSRRVLRAAVAAAFLRKRPLTEEEIEELLMAENTSC